MLEVGFEPTRLSAKDFESFVAAVTPFEQLSRYKNPSTYTSGIVLCLLNTRSWRYQTEYPSFSLINGFDRTCTYITGRHPGVLIIIALIDVPPESSTETNIIFVLNYKAKGMGRTRTYDHGTPSSRDFIQLNYHSIRRWQRRTSPSNQVELVCSSLPQWRNWWVVVPTNAHPSGTKIWPTKSQSPGFNLATP